MSFQRIFEMAKRQGMPIVMTDRNGEDPMVVLPLDMYEALVEAGPSQTVNRMHPQKQEQGQAEPRTVEASKTEVESDLLADLSVEERFYIDTPNEERIG